MAPETTLTEVDLGGAQARSSVPGRPGHRRLRRADRLLPEQCGEGPGQIGEGEVDTQIKDSLDLQIDYDHLTDPPVSGM